MRPPRASPGILINSVSPVWSSRARLNVLEDPWRRGTDSVSNLPSTHSRLPTWLPYHRLAVTYTADSPRVAETASSEYTLYSCSLDNQPAFTRKRVPNCHGIANRANRGYVIFGHGDVDHNPPGPLLHSFDSLIGPIVLVPCRIPFAPSRWSPPQTNQSDIVGGPIVHGALTKSTPGTILALVHRSGDCGTTVGDTTVSPLAPISHFLALDAFFIEWSLGGFVRLRQ